MTVVPAPQNSQPARYGLIFARWVSLALVATVSLYTAMALILGLIPINRDFVDDPDGVTIYLRSNGIHAEIVMPLTTTTADWRPESPPPSIQAGSAPRDWISFGWGDRDFYLNTRNWRDVGAASAFGALLGSDSSVLHVEFVYGPSSQRGDVVLRLAAAQYRELVAYVRDRVVRDEGLRPKLIPGRSFGDHDRFYEAKERYSPILTCNEWARRALAAAGVRTAVWSPLDVAIFHHLRDDVRIHASDVR